MKQERKSLALPAGRCQVFFVVKPRFLLPYGNKC